jgi:hypothetical protein
MFFLINLGRRFLRSAVITIGLFSAAGACAAAPAVTNHIQNGDLESSYNDITPWRWSVSGGALAEGKVDSTVSHTGRFSFKITNRSTKAPEVYGGLRQIVKGLKPLTAYQLRVWVKGEGVTGAQLACGPRWEKRFSLPNGTYGWNRVVFDLETDESPGDFNVVVIAYSPVGALWVDDVELVETSEAVAVEGPSKWQPLRNGGFDEPSLAWWDWALSGQPLPQATGELDSTVKRSGTHSLKITSNTPEARNVYGRIRQLVDGLEPGKRYRLRMWIKGDSVNRCVVALGEGWRQRKNLPSRSYDWQEFDLDFTADRERGFQVLVIVGGPTAALWIDDMEIVPSDLALQNEPRLSPAASWERIEPSLAFYPLAEASAETLFERPSGSGETAAFPNIVLVPDKPGVDGSGGGTGRFAYDKEGLHAVFDAQGLHRGEVIGGESMWRGDSVQLGIDLRPDVRADGGVAPWYELGFALLDDDTVNIHAWRTGQDPDFDYASIRAKGVRTSTGYRIIVTIPWHVFKADSKHLPPVLGLNVVFNSAGVDGVRQVAEWTRGIAHEKKAADFAWAVRSQEDNPDSISVIRLTKGTYDHDERVGGLFIEYARQGLAPATLIFDGHNREVAEGVSIGEVHLPAVAAGGARSVFFSTAVGQFDRQGIWFVSAERSDADGVRHANFVASATLQRVNLQSRLAGLHEEVEARYEVLKASPWRQDAVFDSGLRIVDHYLESMSKTPRAERFDQDPSWSLLQLQELKGVLDDLEVRSRKDASLMIPRGPEVTGPIVRSNGVLKVATEDGVLRPAFFNGFGHFDAVVKDMPFLQAIGGNVIQQERGPSELRSDGSVGAGVGSILKTLRDAEQQGTRVDLLLSPHYFPRWVSEQYPEVTLKSADSQGFIRFNIDHPEARRVIEKWLRTIVPQVKDFPALFGFCISNEPAYVFSGKDEHSRAGWVKWLRERHGDIDALNRLYGTKWQSFEEVPVPPLTMPSSVEARRAFYDWIKFNQFNFAEWHRWMADIVREMAPSIPLHAKLMPVVFDRPRLVDGIDAELFAEFTDIAGNDATSYLEPHDGYAFKWRHQEMWYDLLNSYRDQPVFNSENHFIPDGFPARHISPDHTRAVIWQGGLHHQWATTLWVWESPKSPALSGSIRQRPANTFAASQTMLDMQRLAPEFAALNQASSDVALLYSMPSVFWNKDYMDALTSAYTALVFMGKKVTFVSERQLAEGRRSAANVDVRCIVLAQATNVTDGAVQGLVKFSADGGRVIAIGSGNLHKDEYARPRSLPEDLRLVHVDGNVSDYRLMQALLAEVPNGSLRSHMVLSALDGHIAWGIEHRVVETPAGTLVALTNMLADTQTVRLSIKGTGVDLIDGEPVDISRLQLDSMRPALILVKPTP